MKICRQILTNFKKYATICCALLVFIAGSVTFAGENIDDRIAVLIAVDNSGSMRQTDPDNLRLAATRLFITLLKTGDQTGIIDFASDVKLISPLVEIKSSTDKEILVNKLDQMSAGGNTRIDMAVEEAINLFEKTNVKKKALILISDGALDVNDNPVSPESIKATEILLTESLARLKENNIRVYSVSLLNPDDNPEVQKLQNSLLLKLSNETKGAFLNVSSNAELHKSFIEILKDLIDPPKLPYVKEKKRIKFQVDDTINSINILIDKKNSPGQAISIMMLDKTYDKGLKDTITWTKSKYYEIITLHEKPENGLWYIQSTGNIDELNIDIFADTVYKLKISDIKGDKQASKKLTFFVSMLKKETQNDPYKKVMPENCSYFLSVTDPDNNNVVIPFNKTRDNDYYGYFTPQKEGKYTVNSFSKGYIERLSEDHIIDILPAPVDEPRLFLDQNVYVAGENIKFTTIINDDRITLPDSFLEIKKEDAPQSKDKLNVDINQKTDRIMARIKTYPETPPGIYVIRLHYYDINHSLKTKEIEAYLLGRVYLASEFLDFKKLNSKGNSTAILTVNSDLEMTNLPVRLKLTRIEPDTDLLSPSDIKFGYKSDFFVKGGQSNRPITIIIPDKNFYEIQKALSSTKIKSDAFFKIYTTEGELLSEKIIPVHFEVGSKIYYYRYFLLAILAIFLITLLIYAYWRAFIFPYNDNLSGFLVDKKVFINKQTDLKIYKKLFVGSSNLNEVQLSGLEAEQAEIYLEIINNQKKIFIRPITALGRTKINDGPVITKETEIKSGDILILNDYRILYKK